MSYVKTYHKVLVDCVSDKHGVFFLRRYVVDKFTCMIFPVKHKFDGSFKFTNYIFKYKWLVLLFMTNFGAKRCAIQK